MDFILEHWGEQGQLVIDACAHAHAQSITYDEFLDHCTACGGNWGGMLLTSIKALYPEVYEAIPEHMGNKAFFASVKCYNYSTFL